MRCLPKLTNVSGIISATGGAGKSDCFKIFVFSCDELQAAIMINTVKKMNNRMFFITHKINEMLCLEAKSFVGSTYLFCKDILFGIESQLFEQSFF
jgi:hypothetical protein